MLGTSRTRVVLGVVLLCLGTLGSTPASANETDQFTLPTDQSLADLGPYMEAVHYEILGRVTENLNKDLRRAYRGPRPKEIRRLTDPGLVADLFRSEFAPGFIETVNLENALRRRSMRRAFPDQITAHRTLGWIYAWAHLPIDPRRLVLLFQSSTINVHGAYMGTDKIAHFHDLGHIYYKSYLARIDGGMTPEEARDWVVRFYSRGPISESFTIGAFATGVVSNADLASNYAGMLFYQNLTEPIEINGETIPPMLELHEGYWRIAYHVRPESGFLRPFLTDHCNEALNPCVYEIGMRGPIRRHLRKNSDRILKVYADEAGRARPPEWFRDKALELRTFHGQDYGAIIREDKMFSIADACAFPDRPAPPPDASEGDLAREAPAPAPTAPHPAPPSEKPLGTGHPDVVRIG
ncbi:MAG: hypothetical protein ACIARR_12905 [Phycisphaerales bacterium JB059]